MTWTKKKILVVAKAVPVESTKYSDSVCTAGITEDGEFIRIYPIPYRIFCSDQKFSKYDWIEVECAKSTDDQRKESYKVRHETIKVVGHIDTDNMWEERNKIVLPLCSSSIDELKRKWDKDRTSLGIIKVKELIELYEDPEMKEEDFAIEKQKQMVFDFSHENEGFMKKIPKIKNVPHKFRYKFKCESPECNKHDMLCEDWEIFEAERRWGWIYDTPEEVWDAIKNRFETEFVEKCNLHFIMGTWMIIGVYYPLVKHTKRKRIKSEENRSLKDYF